MKTSRVLQACIVMAVGLGFVSCTKAEIEQAMNRPAEIILQSSPCTPAGIASTATPEFCVNVTDIELLRHDTQADVSLTLVNRTGRRLFIYLSGAPSLTDSGGTRWNAQGNTGLGSGTHYPVTLEPNVETQGSLTFYQGGQATTDQIFSLRGQIAIAMVDARGQPIPYKVAVTRGFNISGIRLPQQPPQSSAPTEQNQDSKLAQASPQGVAAATQKPPASSQSSAPGAIAGASDNGQENSMGKASSNASSSFDQRAPRASSENFQISLSSAAAPDLLGIRLGVSGVKETRDALSQFKPTLVLEDTIAAFVGMPNTQHVIYLTGQGQRAGVNSYRQFVQVRFSEPPNSGKALYVSRNSSYEENEGPSFENTLKALRNKYGEPGFQNNAKGIFLVWAWSTDRQLVPLTEQHPCAARGRLGVLGSSAVNSDSEATLHLLKAGCAAVIHAYINVTKNDIIGSIRIIALDVFHAYKSIEATRKLLTDYQQQRDKDLREKAGQKTPGF